MKTRHVDYVLTRALVDGIQLVFCWKYEDATP